MTLAIRSFGFALLASGAVLICGAQVLVAQSLFERLVLPGDLIGGHADLQKNCQNRHTSFSQGAQSQLCADCHKDVANDIENRSGFHGKSPEVAAGECRHCHTDHIGKDAAIVEMDSELFDHDLTDYSLKGAHVVPPCAQCHLPAEKFRTAKGECIDCHKEDEPHRGELGEDCAGCHTETTWVEVGEFDHSKTDFALDDAHEAVTCAACHIGERYKDLPSECIDCHRIQDVHQDRFGPKCEDCHVSTKWTEVRFNHDLDTDFTLVGAHQDASCNSCHENNAF